MGAHATRGAAGERLHSAKLRDSQVSGSRSTVSAANFQDSTSGVEKSIGRQGSVCGYWRPAAFRQLNFKADGVDSLILRIIHLTAMYSARH